MLHFGLDLSRTRLDVRAMDAAGAPVLVTTAAPDAGGLASLVYRLGGFGEPVTAVIESMNGARFVHDQLELRGWAVEIADAVKVKGFAPWPARPTRSTRGCWVACGMAGRSRSIRSNFVRSGATSCRLPSNAFTVDCPVATLGRPGLARAQRPFGCSRYQVAGVSA
jgi:hypothetical protein